MNTQVRGRELLLASTQRVLLHLFDFQQVCSEPSYNLLIQACNRWYFLKFFAFANILIKDTFLFNNKIKKIPSSF